MILFLAGLQDISQRHLRGRRARQRARGQGVLVHHAAEPEAHDHAGRGPADHPAFPGLRAVAPDDQGGPNDTTQVLVRYIYQTAFRDSELGRASAMAVFLFVIMGAFSAIQFVVGREEEMMMQPRPTTG
jgi:hypothetical protein